MKNLNDFVFCVLLLNGEVSVLFTVTDMEDVELPEGFSQYLMLYDGKESVVASYKMIDGYEVMGWMVAKGTLPCSDGCYRIERYDSLHTVSFNEWAYGKLAVFDYNTGDAGRNSIVSDIWHQDLFFRKGKMYLIEAASGTGKSSLCSYIYGYRNDYQGIINFDETNIKAYSVKQWIDLRKHSLSMLFQDLRIFTELTALENVQLKNNLTGYKKKKEVLAYFEQLGIADKINVKVGKLSFGQQQRVAFIRALCQPFDFLFLDEPISHLDNDNSRIMGEIITAEVERQGAGVIATSIGKHIDLPYDHIFQL